MTFEPIDAYLEKLRGLPRPSEEEIRQWREEAVAGNQGAQIRFTKAYLAQTAEIALLLKPEGWSNEETINEANLVLIRLIYETDVEDVGTELEARIRERFAE